MKISYNWLKQYTNCSLSPEETADLLTFSGLEVEGIEKIESVKGGLEGVLIGEVKTCEKHPDADRLKVTTVDVGQSELLQIVCGAANVAAGQKVPVATVGTKIWTSETEFFEIKKSKIRGVASEGMICAEDELGLGNSHDGIMVLNPETKVGMLAKDYFQIEDDYCLEIGLTPNRSDAASHLGVARDLLAALNVRQNSSLKIEYPSVENFKVDNTTLPFTVKVENTVDCPRYSGIAIKGITVKESPDWLKNKLKTVGLRSINNIVDITNFVLMEMGQPLHAFDASQIPNRQVIVKQLPKDTKFTTLDEVERTLAGTELMICSTEGGMCIAGVFGGLKSGVNEQTTDVFLESAYFNPVSIRKTSKLHGLKTDASFRYERGGDPNITIYALKRAALLIKELAGGEIASEIIDVYPESIVNKEIKYSLKNLNAFAGKEIPVEMVKNILHSLEMPFKKISEDELLVSIPTNKVDVTRPCDLTEEILRIYGYNNIEIGEQLNSCLSYTKKPNPEKIQNIIADLLSDNGFSEIMNNSLSKAEYYENNPEFEEQSIVKILNPLSKELSVMRQTLVYSGLEVIAYNLNRKIANQKLYEFGKIYKKNAKADEKSSVTQKYQETKNLCLFMTGLQNPVNWKTESPKTDFYYLKSYAERIFKRLRIDLSKYAQETVENTTFGNAVAYKHKDSGKYLATVGVLHPKLLQKFDIKQEVFCAEINWDLVLKNLPNKEVEFRELPKFPEVKRDLALVVNKEVSFESFLKLANETEKHLLKKVSLFDIYEGDKIEKGKKSYAISFVLQDEEKTLTDKQIESVMSKLAKNFEEKLGAKIRA